jgi:hypothetical protein
MALPHETRIPDRLAHVGAQSFDVGAMGQEREFGALFPCPLALPLDVAHHSEIISSTTLNGKSCGEAVNPAAERPEQMALSTCRCAWTTQKKVAHMPTAEADNEDLKPRFKVDHTALPMPEPNQQERLAPRGDIKSERGRHHNLYTRARSSECAPYAGNHLERRLQCQRLLSSFLSTSANPVS